VLVHATAVAIATMNTVAAATIAARATMSPRGGRDTLWIGLGSMHASEVDDGLKWPLLWLFFFAGHRLEALDLEECSLQLSANARGT
jgi:hypothetical protein